MHGRRPPPPLSLSCSVVSLQHCTLVLIVVVVVLPSIFFFITHSALLAGAGSISLNPPSRPAHALGPISSDGREQQFLNIRFARGRSQTNSA